MLLWFTTYNISNVQQLIKDNSSSNCSQFRTLLNGAIKNQLNLLLVEAHYFKRQPAHGAGYWRSCSPPLNHSHMLNQNIEICLQ